MSSSVSRVFLVPLVFLLGSCFGIVVIESSDFHSTHTSRHNTYLFLSSDSPRAQTHLKKDRGLCVICVGQLTSNQPTAARPSFTRLTHFTPGRDFSPPIRSRCR